MDSERFEYESWLSLKPPLKLRARMTLRFKPFVTTMFMITHWNHCLCRTSRLSLYALWQEVKNSCDHIYPNKWDIALLSKAVQPVPGRAGTMVPARLLGSQAQHRGCCWELTECNFFDFNDKRCVVLKTSQQIKNRKVLVICCQIFRLACLYFCV